MNYVFCAASVLYGVIALFVGPIFAQEQPMPIRIATFNVSMESGNYAPSDAPSTQVLLEALASGENPQIMNIAEIIQRVQPDILLLNEFDFIPDQAQGIDAFVNNYLKVPQAQTLTGIDYPYRYVGPVNTGVPSSHDFDGDGVASGKGGDAFGFGLYPGHYGMALVSRYPIDRERVRSFRYFRWADMPGALVPQDPAASHPFYTAAQWADFRLPSKALWDIPVLIDGQQINILALHPTPPVFDGPENRNGLRNHDEIRLLADYLSGRDYIYDDQASQAAFAGDRFVIVGDLNASVYSGETYPGTMEQLFDHPQVAAEYTPTSNGGLANAPGIEHADEHTAGWRSRADYVLPSKAGIRVEGGAVFWPEPQSPLHRLVEDRKSSSDHRLVYLDLTLTDLAD